MANRTRVTILEEGPRNAVVSVSGVLDTSNYTGTAAIAPASFTNNESLKTLLTFAIADIQYAVASPLTVEVSWQATTDQLGAVVAESNRLDYQVAGGGLFPSNIAAAGFTGALTVATAGYTSGTVGFTIILKLKKVYT